MDELCLQINDYYVGDLSTLQITGDLEILHPLGKLKLRMAYTPNKSNHFTIKTLCPQSTKFPLAKTWATIL